MRLLILGVSGLVGGHVLEQGLAEPSISAVIAPSRRPLPLHAKLTNPVADDLMRLAGDVASWKADAVICALGTTMKKARSRRAFRVVDHDLPLAFANAAYQSGVSIFALVSAKGASTSSLFFYSRVKGETERDLEKIGFRSLTIVRPGLIGGNRAERRRTEAALVRVVQWLGAVLPAGWRVNPASDIAAELIQAVLKIGG